MKELLFYDLMWYNYPLDKTYFYLNHNLIEKIKYKPILKKKLSSNTQNYENILNKYSFLYKQIPFIENIYVCNSLSFKSIKDNSDIDLFIITKENRIFLAKFFVWIFFKIFKMYWTHKKWKFCIWFYISNVDLDLYPISIYPIDLYLSYWIAHLQPLYSEKKENIDNIFMQNMWVKQIIPNFNGKHKKILKINITHDSWILKKFLEKIFWWTLLNNIIWYFWKKRMNKNKKSMWKRWKNIIISDNILKFQAPDIRKLVYLKYKTLKHNNKYKIRIEKWLF